MARISRADRADDAALLAGLALGDAAVSAAFVRRFQGAVYGLAVSITRDPRAAEDVSQEVFLRVWRAADTYDVRRASVLTWILTITRNTAIDTVRARRSTPTDGPVLDQLVRDTLGPEPDLAETALHRVETDRALRRLHALSPTRRALSSSPCSAAAPRRRSPTVRASRSGRRRPGSGPACAGSRRSRRWTMAERWHPDEDLVLDAVLGTGDQRDDVVAHLASCTRCRGAHGALVDGVDLVLPAVPRSQPPTGFESRVLDQLAELRPAGAPSRTRLWPSALAAAAAGLLGVAVGAAGVGLLTDDPAEEPPAVVSAPAVPLVTADGTDVG